MPSSLYLVKICPFIITVFSCASVHMYLFFLTLEKTHLLYAVTIASFELFGKISEFRYAIRAERAPTKMMLRMQNGLCIDQRTSTDFHVVIFSFALSTHVITRHPLHSLVDLNKTHAWVHIPYLSNNLYENVFAHQTCACVSMGARVS